MPKKRLEFIRGVAHLENNSESPAGSKPVVPVSVEAILSTNSTAQLHRIYSDTLNGEEGYLVLESLANNCFINDDLVRKIYVRAAVLKKLFAHSDFKSTGLEPAHAYGYFSQTF